MMPDSGRAAVRIGGRRIDGWSEYSISLDLLEPADSFSLTFPNATGELYEMCAKDAEVEILVDDVRVLTGIIGSRNPDITRDGATLTIGGRDKIGRLIDESMDLGTLSNLTIEDLAKKIAAPWFDNVSLSNASNRALIRGGKLARPAGASKEPAIDRDPKPKRRVKPGDTRYMVLEHFLEKADLLAWSSGDGKTLIVGQANYSQVPMYRFFLPAPGSQRSYEGNVLRASITDDIEDCFSEVKVVGAVKGSAGTYGVSTRVKGVAVDGPGARGIGGRFKRRKVLLIKADDVRNNDEAEKRAQRELALRQASSFEIELVVRGHRAPEDPLYSPSLYVPDTMADLEIEAFGIKGKYLVTAATFTNTRAQGTSDGGPRTRLLLVPKGTLLRT